MCIYELIYIVYLDLLFLFCNIGISYIYKIHVILMINFIYHKTFSLYLGIIIKVL